MGQDFSPAPRDGAGMGLDFFHTLKPYYLNKHINISIFCSIQCDSLPLFCYVLYYEIFIYLLMIVLLNTWIYYSIFFFLKFDLI